MLDQRSYGAENCSCYLATRVHGFQGGRVLTHTCARSWPISFCGLLPGWSLFFLPSHGCTLLSVRLSASRPGKIFLFSFCFAFSMIRDRALLCINMHLAGMEA